MNRRKWIYSAGSAALAFTGMATGSREAQAQEHRPSLFFREDWAESPAALPVTQEHVTHQDLQLELYGPGREGIKKSNHDQPYDDPFYIWSGEAEGNWAVALRHRGQMVDLSRQGKIVWRSKQQGLRQLRMVLRLADGNWLVSEEADGPSLDWRIREFVLSDTRWYGLDINTVVERALAKSPDLRRVDAVGFTDLMRGGRTTACSRLDWIEVYGHGVPR
ncbi:MAG: hypothetical protein KIT83_00445 [Bryobacterales bacterium]|nr:hypothetical protein [Bryobacterales bacterium]